MNLANPSALLWAMLAIPVVIFYVLKVRLRRVPVSTVIFWRQIFEQKKPRSIWQRLRHLISLAVQLALLFLLIGALAEPFLAGENLQARRIVLVFDNSASMNSTDVQQTRFLKAKEEAQRIIRGMRYRDEMAIVVAGTQPRVVCGLTGHQGTLLGALDSIDPTDGPTKLAEATALGQRLVEEGDDPNDKARVIVLSDGCVADIASLIDGERVRLIAFGTKAGNVGITRFQARRSPIDPVGYEVLIEVANCSDETAECRLELDLEGNSIDVVPLKLEANGRWSKVIEQSAKAGGKLTAKLMKSAKEPWSDALAADDQAIAFLPKRDDLPVYLTDPDTNLFLFKVLEVNPLTVVKTTKKTFASVPAGAVQVFHKQAPAALPPGPLFIVDPRTDCELWKVGDKLLNPIVTQQDKDSPLMAHLRLDNLLMPEARKLAISAAAGKPQVLAASVTGDPLFVCFDRPQGKVLVLTVNLDQGDLPLRTAFPIMAANALNFFAASRGELREAQATGAIAEVNLPSSEGSELLLRAPNGSTRKLPPNVARATIGPFDRCGVWSIVRAGRLDEPIEEIACNLTNSAESDLRPPEALPAATTVEKSGLIGGISGRPLWFYLVAVAWLLVAAEWWMYQRRIIS
jgi:hypothetical protein